MAWLYQDPRSRNFKVCFRFRGRSYKKSLKTTNRQDAEIILGGVMRTLLRLEQNLLELPPDADILTFVLSDGKQAEKPSLPQVISLQDLIDGHTAACSVGAMEENSLDTTKMHLRHFVATFGKGFAVGSLKLADLQRHVEWRAKKRGIRKRLLSPTTIRKEVATMRAAWNWGVQAGLLSGPFPHCGLKYPKSTAKPPFQTWQEIERQIQAGLSLMNCNVVNERTISASRSGRKVSQSLVRGIPFSGDRSVTCDSARSTSFRGIPFSGDRSVTAVPNSHKTSRGIPFSGDRSDTRVKGTVSCFRAIPRSGVRSDTEVWSHWRTVSFIPCKGDRSATAVCEQSRNDSGSPLSGVRSLTPPVPGEAQYLEGHVA
ncbi:MAG TPA: hypothetical protein VH682_13670 [Gemmataceae bacterium]